MKILFGILASLTVVAAHAAEPAAGDWPNYGRTPGGDRHSPLAQIDRGNVGKLTLAWEYKTGEAGIETGNPTALEATPLVIDGVMYLSTPLGKVIALDPVTGKQRWVRDVGVKRDRHFGDWVSRGVSYWQDSRAKEGAACARRIFFGVVDARMVALDAANGEFCRDFGKGGEINLVPLLRNKQSYGDEYEQTSPPAVIGDLIVVGSAIADNNSTVGATGEVRAFDARTGALRWTWNPVPQDPDDPAYKTWTGAAAHRTRRRQHLVHHCGRSQARPRVPAYHEPRRRLLRRARASATTATPIPWSRCARRPENSSGISRPCITICGTTTMRRRRR